MPETIDSPTTAIQREGCKNDVSLKPTPNTPTSHSSKPIGLIFPEGLHRTISSYSLELNGNSTPTIESLTSKLKQLLRHVFILMNSDDKERHKLFKNRQYGLSKRLSLAGMFHIIFVGLLSLMIEEGLGREYFLQLAIFEFFLNTGLIVLGLKLHLSIVQTEIINYCRQAVTIVIRLLMQIYYGPLFPVWILHSYSLLIILNAYYFNKLAALVNCFIVITASSVTLKISYIVFAEWVQDNQGLGLEPSCNTRKHAGPYGSAILDMESHYIFQIFTIQFVMCVIGLLFSDVSIEQDEENISQRVEIMKEKVLNIEKTKFIGNLSHEARNPLMGSK